MGVQFFSVNGAQNNLSFESISLEVHYIDEQGKEVKLLIHSKEDQQLAPDLTIIKIKKGTKIKAKII